MSRRERAGLPDDDAAIVQALVAEIAARPEPMTLVLRPPSVFHLVAVLQLALRHPGLTGDSRAAAERFLDAARAYFADAPTVLEVIRRGGDPTYDRS